MVSSYNILETLAANGADVSMVNGKFVVTGAPKVPMNKVRSIKMIDPLVEALQRREVLFATAAGGQNYAINIVQFNGTTGRLTDKTFRYAAAASESGTTIADAFRAMINVDQTLALTASGTTSLLLTAKTGSATFTVSTVSAGSGITYPTAPVLNSAGTALSCSGITRTITNGTMVGTSVTATGIANGNQIQVTLGAGDSITFRDGRVATSGAVVTLRIGNQAAGVFNIGPWTDSNIAVVTELVAATITSGTWVAHNARGTAASLASQGITGLTAGRTYGEVASEWEGCDGESGGTTQVFEHRTFANFAESGYYTGAPCFYSQVYNLTAGATGGTAINTQPSTTANPEVNAAG